MAQLRRGNHFGSRIVQASDGTLFVTNGEHFTDRDMAQTFDNDLGKIVHITPDGAPAPGNPFANKPGARPEIWSYGHRNPQGLAINPADGKLWEQEHGPMGGDEINLIVPGSQLRLAARLLRRQLRRHTGRHRQSNDGGCRGPPVALDAIDRAVRYGILHRQPISRLEGQLV